MEAAGNDLNNMSAACDFSPVDYLRATVEGGERIDQEFAAMSTFRLRRFSKPDLLRRLSRENLLRFLDRQSWRPYFEHRGLRIPSAEAGEQLDYDLLAAILASPEDGMPTEVARALYFIDEMSTERQAEILLRDLVGVPVGDTPTAADLALHLWLHDRDLLERRHAERAIWRRKTFLQFAGDCEHKIEVELRDEAELAPVCVALNNWFTAQKHGVVSRIFLARDGATAWLLVRYGGMHQLVGCVEQGRSSSVRFQPEQYDVVGLDTATAEIRINAQLQGAVDVYRAALGQHLFGDPGFFCREVQYSLEPIRTAGAASLACGDIDGLEKVTLVSVTFDRGGPYRYSETRNATDLFAALEHHRVPTPRYTRLSEAIFEAKFEDIEHPRRVAIRPPNITKYTRDEDSAQLDEWLTARGFRTFAAGSPESSRFWSLFSRNDSLRAARLEWQAILGPEFAWSQRLLQPTDEVADVFRDADGRTWRIVTHGPKDLMAVSEHDGADRAIARADALVYELNWIRLAGELTITFGFQFDPEPLRRGLRLAAVGHYTPRPRHSFPVFIVLHDEPTIIQAAVDQLAATYDKILLLVPRSVPISIQPLNRHTIEVIPVRDLVEPQGDGFRLLRPLADVLDRFNAAVLPKTASEVTALQGPTSGRWEDVRIVMVGQHDLTIEVDGVRKRMNYSQLGMADGRTRRPTKPWSYLQVIAASNGVLPGGNAGVSRAQKMALARALKAVLPLADDPLVFHDGSWKARFTIVDER